MPKRPNPSPKPNLWKKSRVALSTWLRGTLLAISARIDDNYPASRYTQLPHDRDLATAQKFYEDSLEAWRKNPIARRIVGIISDYVLGDGITIESKNTRLQRFIEAFWSHPENNIELRLESMCDELTRAGDLFPVLFTEEATGIPIVRFIPKDSITEIITAENDWETELEYIQPMVMGIPKTWLSPKHPDAGGTIMLHYKINPVIGALTGEGDLDAIIPWLQRYSRLLEDRVQIHWAARVFLWFVKVPASKVRKIGPGRRPNHDPRSQRIPAPLDGRIRNQHPGRSQGHASRPGTAPSQTTKLLRVGSDRPDTPGFPAGNQIRQMAAHLHPELQKALHHQHPRHLPRGQRRACNSRQRPGRRPPNRRLPTPRPIQDIRCPGPHPDP